MHRFVFSTPLSPVELGKYQSMPSDQECVSMRFLSPVPMLFLGPLPPSVRSLSLSGRCAYDAVFHLPDGVKTLTLEDDFVSLLGGGLVLPAGLEALYILGGFNRSLSGILPPGLKRLRISGSYSILFESGTLPPTLEELDLEVCQISGILPESLPPGPAELRMEVTRNAVTPSNALQFFRYMLKEDIDRARYIWCHEENIEAVKDHPDVAKAAEDKDKCKAKLADYYSVVATRLWVQLLSSDDKKEIKERFTAWKEECERIRSALTM